MISIHAPAKGATQDLQGNQDTWHDFNPRTREGCDTYLVSIFID